MAKNYGSHCRENHLERLFKRTHKTNNTRKTTFWEENFLGMEWEGAELIFWGRRGGWKGGGGKAHASVRTALYIPTSV